VRHEKGRSDDMRSRLLKGTEELAKVFRQWSVKAHDIRIVTAWATTDCAVCDCLKDARSKISTMVVGLDFYTTSPLFLESFRSVVRIGNALRGGTFHPKLYLFENGGLCCCVMGSSNFTSGGFADNTELNICIEGRASDPFFQQVRTFIEEQVNHSEPISTPEIDDYREQFERLKASRARLARFRASKTAQVRAKARKDRETAGEEPPEQLNKTWPEFIQLILARKRRGHIVHGTADEPGYLQTAERCQAFFAQYRRLAKMPVVERQFVGGTTRDGSWFGSMKGAGYFKQRLNEDPASLDTALDHIPLRGIVNKRTFDAFAARYQWERAGVGTASRLLAMKRPDLFICIDSENRPGIAKAFGVPASSLLTFDGYWDLMQRIWRCPWWRARRPNRALERRVWNARAALLDSLYYNADE
jgi:HKD family nuclease